MLNLMLFNTLNMKLGFMDRSNVGIKCSRPPPALAGRPRAVRCFLAGVSAVGCGRRWRFCGLRAGWRS